MAAGDYNSLFTWYPNTPTFDSSTGRNEPSVSVASGTLWGSLSMQSASRNTVLGSTRNVVTAEIHLSGYPAVSPEDNLVDSQFSTRWRITGIRLDRAKFETVIDAESAEGADV